MKTKRTMKKLKESKKSHPITTIKITDTIKTNYQDLIDTGCIEIKDKCIIIHLKKTKEIYCCEDITFTLFGKKMTLDEMTKNYDFIKVVD